MKIELDNETKQLIDQAIEAGSFPDAATLVGTAVRHLLITREDLGYTRDQIDAMIAQSIASLDRGESVDGEEFFAELELAERKAQQRPK